MTNTAKLLAGFWSLVITTLILIFTYNLQNHEEITLLNKIHIFGKKFRYTYKTYSYHSATCRRPLVAWNPSEYPEYNIIHKIPASFLENHFPPQKYPVCGKNVFPWLFLGSDKKFQEHWMTIIVKTAPGNIDRRNEIRQTWGGLRSVNGSTFAVVFGMGKTGNLTMDKMLFEENEIFGDILQCDFKDSYNNLTLKVISLMGWAYENDIQSSYFMFSDDDVAVRIDRVVQFLSQDEELVSKESLICGYRLSTHETPVRSEKVFNSKWYTPREIYPGALYPYYCNGPNYVMTKPMLQALLCQAIVTDFKGFLWEDVSITGILREKLGDYSNNIKSPKRMFVEEHLASEKDVPGRIKTSWLKWTKNVPMFKNIINSNTTEFYSHAVASEAVNKVNLYWWNLNKDKIKKPK